VINRKVSERNTSQYTVDTRCTSYLKFCLPG